MPTPRRRWQGTCRWPRNLLADTRPSEVPPSARRLISSGRSRGASNQQAKAAIGAAPERSTVSDAYDVQAWPELIGQIYEALEPIRESPVAAFRLEHVAGVGRLGPAELTLGCFPRANRRLG